MTFEFGGIHHLTAVIAKAKKKPGLLYPDPGHAADQEDRQSGLLPG
ncbi:MAG: hypothetical protein MO846_04435 [Candidatus Devosia symbiotica]|nr:hypothetical protein [Candidatus Devosia symbiotica]